MDTIALEKPEESAYLNCSRCGLCLAVCPTYREYLKETMSPRGRVALTRQELDGQLALSPNLVEQMYNCFACMACSEVCPVGIRPAELVLWMRTMSEQKTQSKWKEALFGGLIPHPGRMENATLPLRLYQGLGLRRLAYWLGLQQLLPTYFRDLEAMLPRIPQRPLRQSLPEVTFAGGENALQGGLFSWVRSELAVCGRKSLDGAGAGAEWMSGNGARRRAVLWDACPRLWPSGFGQAAGSSQHSRVRALSTGFNCDGLRHMRVHVEGICCVV